LRCANYVAITEIDPRVADSLLSALRDAGIAAYAAPAAGTLGGAMEIRMPTRPVDRLWVDDQQVDRARAIVARDEHDVPDAAPAAAPATGGETLDVDAAWQQVLASLQSPSSSPVPPWPVSEDVDADAAERGTGAADAAGDEDGGQDGEADDEHFVPPPPPPFPRFSRATVAALLSIIGGLVVLALQVDGGSLTPLAILAIIGGVVSLVWHMRNGPPTDSGWDDGAVV
jgi:hypothetical protein